MYGGGQSSGNKCDVEQIIGQKMAGVEDVITQVGWNSNTRRVKVELVNGIHEEVKPWIALEDLSHVDVNDFKDGNECTICKKSFSSRSKLARHVKDIHDKIKDYNCDKCSFACSQKSSLNLHIKAIHERIKDFKCEQCEYAFPSSSKLARHVKGIHDKIKDYNCDKCSFATGRNYNLSVHIRRHHGKEASKCEQSLGDPLDNSHEDVNEGTSVVDANDAIDEETNGTSRTSKRYKCTVCKKSFKNSCGVARHIEAVHETIKDFKCDQCSYASSMKKSLSLHKKVKHEGKKDYKCPQCEFASVSMITYAAHIKMVHKGIQDHKCNKCGKVYVSRQKLKDHIKSMHDKIRDFKCDQCDYATPFKHNLSVHVQGKHNKENKCDQCDKFFFSPQKLKLHIKNIHDNIRDYKCDLCDYATYLKDILSRHIRLKHGKRDYKCNKCAWVRSSSSEKKLIRHMKRVHDKIKEYKCDHCPYECFTEFMLSKHIRKYHEEMMSPQSDKVKIFKCGQCYYTTYEECNVADHIKAIHLKADYKCKECDFSSHSKYFVDKHMNESHKLSSGMEIPEKMQDWLAPVAKRIEISRMLDEGTDMNVIATKLHCSKQLIYKVRGPTYNSKLSHETPKQNRSTSEKFSRKRKLNYSCDLCKYQSANESFMARHKMTVHDKIKHFQCDKCSLSFALRGSLNIHIKAVHERIKDFKCELCEYTASYRSKIQYHIMEVHDKVKNFKCDQCDYATSKKCNLSDHIKAIHLKADYKCKECDFAYPSRYLVAKHMKESHKLSSGMEIWVKKEPTTQDSSEAEHSNDTEDPLNISSIKIQSQSTEDVQDGVNSPRESTFSKEQLHKALQMKGNSAHWVRKKAAISIAHCGRLNLPDLTSIQFQSVSIVEHGVEIKNTNNQSGAHEFIVPYNQNKSEPCHASLVIMYLNCLKRAPRALGPGDTLFNQARHEELCNLGQEVASLLGLDHPQLYTGHCFSPKIEDGENEVTEEDFTTDEPLLTEEEFKVEPV